MPRKAVDLQHLALACAQDSCALEASCSFLEVMADPPLKNPPPIFIGLTGGGTMPRESCRLVAVAL